MSAVERVAELEATIVELIVELREQIAAQEAYIRGLEARLAKDSHTSGKPPSGDGFKRKTKSLRQKSGKKPSGQLGHRGETLHLVATPDEVVEHRPSHCPQCQTPLGEAEVVLRERRQMQELPAAVRLVVSEHQALHVRCPHCAHVSVSVGAFPAEVAKMKALLREMKAATDQARTGGQLHLTPAVHADFLDRYQALLKAGLAANPPPPTSSANRANAVGSNTRLRATCSNGS
jgi:hypothetical protein